MATVHMSEAEGVNIERPNDFRCDGDLKSRGSIAVMDDDFAPDVEKPPAPVATVCAFARVEEIGLYENVCRSR